MDVFLYGKWIKWEDDERMSEIINAIKYCYDASDDDYCHRCPAWREENYVCSNAVKLDKEFSKALIQEHDNLIAEVERLKQEIERLTKYELMYNNYWKYGTFER